MPKGGLTTKEANSRLKKYGLNEIQDVNKITPLRILLRQIKSNFLIYLLTAAVIISFFVGKSVTAYAILAVIIMVVVVGFIQEYKAEQAINSLKNMLVSTAIALRDGREKEIQTSQIVPGDILILRNGEKIPADCVLIDENELRINEAVLTGESSDVAKKVRSGKKFTDKNLIFMGTFIVNGRCTAKVMHTGMNTKFGKIADLISSAEKEMPLQIKVNRIVKYMVVLAVVISVLTGMIIFWRSPVINEEVIVTTLILVIALSVSAFPEGFPVVLITTLAAGARKMALKNAIVNRMSIIETLGETTVICSDKTGTITKGEMTVKKVFSGGKFYSVTGTGYQSQGELVLNSKPQDVNKDEDLQLLIHNALLCNDAIIERTGDEHDYGIIGSPTEAALLILGAKTGIFKEDLQCSREREIPFNSERKMMSVLCKANDDHTVYVKGAPEFLLKKCKYARLNGQVVKLTETVKQEIFAANKKMTTDALRTIALAYKPTKTIKKTGFEEDLIFTGLVGMEDPAREEVKATLKQCATAGINVKMITGDNKETARAIAKKIGLHGKLIDGEELDTITDDELAKIIGSIAIFARVKPEHKLRIVGVLKSNGEIVTMTGDGVNDAPALKEAHIGIAMGKNGTDVSRSVADLTLKDDNFATIVYAIGEGRAIFKNIRKFATYQLTCNFSELAILFIGVLLGPFLGWHIPLLLALQILFMNLVTDNLPAITLGLNPSSTDTMLDPPRKSSQILNKSMIILLIFTGVVLTLMVLAAYFISFNIMNNTTEYARTVALFTLIGLEIAAAYNYRSFRKGILTRGLMVNPYLFYASAISLLATFAIIYTPLNKVFETVPIGIDGFIMAIVAMILFAILFDVLKFANNKKNFLKLEHV
jgi:Ca2+-transporting ATPase